MPEPPEISCYPNCLHCHIVQVVNSHVAENPDKDPHRCILEIAAGLGALIGYGMHGRRANQRMSDQAAKKLMKKLIASAARQIQHSAAHYYESLTAIKPS